VNEMRRKTKPLRKRPMCLSQGTFSKKNSKKYLYFFLPLSHFVFRGLHQLITTITIEAMSPSPSSL
jgi:hypothetical protein